VNPANLARRPFVNERLPNLVFAVAAVVMLGLTVRHALLIRALLPRRTSALHDEVTRLEEESKRLRSEQASLRSVAPEPKALARWIVIKELVDRRAFSWTGLFARLEERLPEGARLVSIAPAVRRGEIVLDVQAVVRSPEVGWQFIRSLEEDGAFDDVFPLSEGESGEFHYTMRYRPRAPRNVAAAATAAAAPAGRPAKDEDDSAEEDGDGDPAAGNAAPGQEPEARR
jgi:Tfp pilus assembly protein PilN